MPEEQDKSLTGGN